MNITGLKRVVITGMGAVTPLGNDVESMWEAMLAGKSGTDAITAFDPAPFDSKIAGEVKNFDPLKYLTPKETKRTERFAQFAVAAAGQAIKDANLSIDSQDPFRYGVIIGSGMGSMELIEKQHSVYLERGAKKITPFMIPMLITNMAAGQVAIKFGFKGPNFCTVTACASGAHAIGEAMRAIQLGEADAILSGGAEACVTPMAVGGFCALQALSKRNDDPKKASRPFDKERDGFVIGEGSGIVVLEELEHAKKRGAKIHAELVGYGLTADAYHITAPNPDGLGAARAMQIALEDSGCSPESIGYINAHGTSTSLNDKIETEAIKKALGSASKKVAVSSTKSMTGHLIGAAGGVETIVCALAVEQGALPPTINYEHPDPECDLDYIPNNARETSIEAALSNSLGFGGHNATLIVKKFSS